MQAILGKALPMTATPKWLSKLAFIYVKMANPNDNGTSYLGVPDYGMTNASNFKCNFTPDSNLKMGTKKWAKKMTLMHVKAPRLKNSVMSYQMVLRVRDDQCNHYKCGFTPDIIPNVVNIDI